MKKLFTILGLIAIIGVSSCKQNWTCQCTQTDGNVTNTQINGGTFLHAKHTCYADSGKCSLLTDGRQ